MIYRIILFVSAVLSCCTSEAQLKYRKTTDYGTFEYSEQDQQTVDDLITVCKTKLPNILNILKTRISQNVLIQIYPDQEAYDKNIIAPELKGSPAISGNGRIQLVSPLSKIRIDTISYTSRLMFLIHEYVHISLDQIEKPVPTFIDEGLASYYSSRGFYSAITHKFKSYFTERPTLDQLTNSYYNIPASDVYSFLFVVFFIKTEGEDQISLLIRKPEIIKSKNSDWIRYLNDYLNFKKHPK